MNPLATDATLDTAQTIVLGAILLLLLTVGRRRDELSQPGWSLIVCGFALLLLASWIGVASHFEGLSRFTLIDNEPVRAILEKLVGYTAGFVLIAAGLLCWIPNITSLAELRKSERTNQALLQAFPDLIMKIDRHGVYQWVHVPEGFTPVWKSTDPVGRSVKEVLSPALAEKVLASHQQALTTGQSQQFEYVAAVGGRANCREARVVPFDRQGVFVIVRDITARKQTDQMLQRYTEELELARTRHERQTTELTRQANQLKIAQANAEQASHAKSEFLAHMSHEIRTPMTAILGYADILIGGVDRSERLNAALTIRRNGEYLLAIINDILDLSKIEAGKLEIDVIDCSPTDLVADVVALMRVRAESKGIPLQVEFDGSIPDRIRGDPIRLRQILINLMGNAVKFTEIGFVRLVSRLIDAHQGQPKLQFVVVDSGSGIPEDQIGHLFRPFAQAEGVSGRPVSGTGLGLAISKRLAEMMGGGITVQSTPGEGSTFTVTVPTGPLEGRRLFRPSLDMIWRQDPESEHSAPEARLDCRILLVEDGPDNQRLIAFLLRKAGATVELAEDGRQAVEMVRGARFGRRHGDIADPFDVILMDMQMPVMDGYEATRKLRREGYPGPIIALTAHAMTSERQRCLDAGCDDFATKPIDRQRLLAMIRRHLEPSTVASGGVE